MGVVKLDLLNTVKSMILANSDFCKDFDKCVTFYKDFLKESGSTPSETMRVFKVSYVGRGGSGGEKVEE